MDSLLVAVTHGRLYTVRGTILPSFVKRPSQGIIPGQTVTFNVLATGLGSIHVQGRGTAGDTVEPIGGATSTMTTPPITRRRR
jgi:hypothetical protein